MSEMRIRQLNRLENKPYISVKDPISALTHFIGFIASIFFTPVLLSKAGISNSDPLLMVCLSIFCLSLITLYGASSAYHTFVLPERYTTILKKIDHISVFFLIAGTYTPLCLNALGKDGLVLLCIVWATAILGTVLKLFWVYCPRYVSSIIYIFMGWLAIMKIRTIYLTLDPRGFILLLTGGILYTLGGIIYAFKIRISKDWSEHEVFHILVLLGSLCHYLLIFFYIA